MKSLSLIIGLILLAAIGYVVWDKAQTSNEINSEHTQNDSSVGTHTISDPTLTDDNAEETDEVANDDDEMGDMDTHTDVGMEFPIADDEDLVACTMDAKICPDGSAVGRVGPDCQFAACPTTETSEETVAVSHIFDVSGTNFAFDREEMVVKVGDAVTVNFMSADGFHDWVVDEFSARTDRVQTGGKTSVTFVADKAGTYEYYCSVGSHRTNGMVGVLIVE